MRTRFQGPGLALLVSGALAGIPLGAQQVPDTAFHPDLGPPAFPAGAGPLVAVDGAHNNFHTLDGRYAAFGRLLRDQGFRVEAWSEPFTASALADADVLVVANALSDRNYLGDDWSLPTPSAFTDDEIDAVRTWVERGGALLLIADHMPFPGAAEELGAAFGFELLNGFVTEGGPDAVGEPLVFRRSDGSLASHPIAEGIDSVATFTGEAFRVPDEAVSLLTLRRGTESIDPDTAWTFHEGTPSTDVGGLSQGAVRDFGSGRVAVLGDAAVFCAQLTGPDATPTGMNAPVAAQNPRFLLNLLLWLTGEDPAR